MESINEALFCRKNNILAYWFRYRLTLKSTSQVVANKIETWPKTFWKSKTNFYYTCLIWHFVGLVHANFICLGMFHFTWECLILKIGFSSKDELTFEIQSSSLSNQSVRQIISMTNIHLRPSGSRFRKVSATRAKSFMYAC